MRRISVVVAVCVVSSLALAAPTLAAGGSASGASGGAGARRAAKAPKSLNYEYCGSVTGCGWQVAIFKKAKTFVEGGGVEEGTFTTGKKGLLELHFNNGCSFVLHKVKGTKNYAGEEPPGGPEDCAIQTIEFNRV